MTINFPVIVVFYFVTLASAVLVWLGLLWFNKRAPKIQWMATAFILIGYVAIIWVQPNSILLSNFAVILAAIEIGWLLSKTISNKNALIIFCITIAVVDYFSFSGGLTAKIIEQYKSGTSQLLHYLTIVVPFSDKAQPVVGIGDLLIIANIFQTMMSLKHPRWHCFVVPVIGLMIALTLGLLNQGIYALPFIAITVILYLSLAKSPTNINQV